MKIKTRDAKEKIQQLYTYVSDYLHKNTGSSSSSSSSSSSFYDNDGKQRAKIVKLLMWMEIFIKEIMNHEASGVDKEHLCPDLVMRLSYICMKHIEANKNSINGLEDIYHIIKKNVARFIFDSTSYFGTKDCIDWVIRTTLLKSDFVDVFQKALSLSKSINSKIILRKTMSFAPKDKDYESSEFLAQKKSTENIHRRFSIG